MDLLVSNPVPFDRQRRVDAGALRAHVTWLAEQGVAGFLPGADEFLYLYPEEKRLVHQVVLESASDAYVLPCVWDPDPEVATVLARHAEDHGAAGVVLPPPLGVPLPPSALRAWYSNLADAVTIPVYAAHDPAWANALQVDALTELFLEGQLAGLADRSCDLQRLRRMTDAHTADVIACGDELAGEVATLPALAGFVSVMANLWPVEARAVMDQDAPAGPWLQRMGDVRRAGGLLAVKTALGMRARAPLHDPEQKPLKGLPPVGFTL
ncbi:MAG: dihydrodipicolinate synthase family protein [Alphaproteobacteria bacterium]|nr:dihydrodipicolinate synthase family protein [Alphaproteobacteria bacterium]